MTENQRNVAVGLTVIVALGLLAAMIVAFTGLPEVFQGGYTIRFVADSTHDVRKGDSVNLAGIRIGRITSVGFTDDDNRKGITFLARIDGNVRISSNVRCYVYAGGGFKGAYLELKPEGQYRVDPQTGQRMEYLPTDGSVTIPMEVMAGGGLIPDELIQGLKSFGKLAENLNTMIAPPTAATTTAAGTGPATTTSAPAVGIPGMLERIDRTLDALYAITGNQQNQANLQGTLANLNKASAQMVEAMDGFKSFANQATKVASEANITLHGINTLTTQASQDLHGLTNKLIEDADKISQLMMTLNKVAMKIESGEGAAGKLLNDPALYNNLVETAKSLGVLIKDFDALAKQWKEHGVEMKLK